MNYVCGFLFHPQRKAVALIEKKKPAFQRGFLNGIGGKIEELESPRDAMIREFKEETGVRINRWELFRIERFENNAPGGGGCVAVWWFSAVAELAEWDALRSVTDETVVRWSGDITNPKLMYNLRYLIPMAEVLMDQPPGFMPKP